MWQLTRFQLYSFARLPVRAYRGIDCWCKMSCFCGQMNVYKEVSIDRFDGLNLNASAYFLSHCHTDHMVGLSSERLENKFRYNSSTKLYVSEITKILLLEDKQYHFLKPYMHVLPIEEPKLIRIKVDDDYKEITVTLLPAGHCPGSVMFLFEGFEGNALYTGDFRLPKGSAARMKCLHSAGHKLKKIDHLHIDTTFCIPDATYIPGREQCLEALVGLVGGWISKGENHIIRMNLSAKYGYEYLYEALYDKFKAKIYSARASQYKCLPDIAKVLTDDPAHAQIYACFKTEKVKEKNWSQWQESDADEFTENKKLKFLHVTLSTLYFTCAAQPEDVKICIGENRFRLCFSFHSSLSEVCDFVRYIKPGVIHANVIPRSGETFKSVEDRLMKLCFGDDLKQDDSLEYKPIGKLQNHRQNTNNTKNNTKHRRKFILNDSDSDEEFKFVARKRKKVTH